MILNIIYLLAGIVIGWLIKPSKRAPLQDISDIFEPITHSKRAEIVDMEDPLAKFE